MSLLDTIADTITRSLCTISIFNPIIDYIGGSSTLRIAIINKSKHEKIIYTTHAMPARKWVSTSQALLDAGFSKVDEESVSITLEKGDDGKFEDICRLVEEFSKGGKRDVVKM
jgi:hypothetical protein